MKTISLESSNHSKILQEKENTTDSLPKGTCNPNDYSKFQQYKIILSYPLSQYLTFPGKICFFPCVIVTQNVEGQEPIYHLFYEILKKRLVSAQKQPNNIGCNYIISKKEKPKKDQYFVGKLRGNFRNNQFILYDSGQNPKKKCVRKRKQLGFINFSQQSIFNRMQSKLQILIPEIEQTAQSCQSYPKYHPKEFIPLEQKENMLLTQFNKKQKNVIKLSQKTREKRLKNSKVQNQTLTQYFKVLDKIEGKFDCSLEINGNLEVLKFNTRTANTMSLKIGYPLNLLQGFAIALSIIERSNN